MPFRILRRFFRHNTRNLLKLQAISFGHPIAFFTSQSGRDWQCLIDRSHHSSPMSSRLALPPPATTGGHPAGGVAHLPASGLELRLP